MTAADIAAIQSTLRAVSTNASSSTLSAVPRRSTSTARLRPGSMGELDMREALPRANRVQRSEISALWDANRHGFLARELQSEGMLHPRPPEGRLPDTTLAQHDTRPPLTPSGALIHEQLQRERAASAAASRPSTSSAALVGRSTAGQRRPQAAFAVPWLPASDETARQLERHGVRPSTSQPLLQQAPGLRISKAAARGGGGLPLPPSVPSNRSEAVRLAELLSQLLATRGGTWEELWRVHDAALAELVLQVGVHCAERGALLQRIRKFFGSALRWSRNGDAAKQA